MKRKLIPIIFLILVLSTLLIYFLFPFDRLIKEKIEQSLGDSVSVERLKIRWNHIDAYGVSVKTTSGSEFARIKEIKIKIYFLALLRKEVELKEIHLKQPNFYLLRQKNGKWQLPSLPVKSEPSKESTLKLSIKELDAVGGILTLKDEVKNSQITLNELNFQIKSKNSIFQSSITSISLSANLTEGGSVNLKTDLSLPDDIVKGTIKIKDLNIDVLKPYVKGDVKIKKGIIDFDSNFTVDRGYVKAPSTVRAKNIEIEPKGFLMGISAPLLIELLKNKEEIVLSFNIWGRWNNLQNDLESVIKKQITEQLGKKVTSPIQSATKPLTDIIRKVK